MQSLFKRGKRPPSDLETTDTPSHHPEEQSNTPTLLNQPIPTAVPPMNGTEKLDSIHALHGTVTNDAEKYLTSPSSDVKPLPDDADAHAAHLHADANEKQDRRVSTTQTEDEDAAGYLKGFPLYMAYLAMLLSIFLVSLDFTIM
jgi:hypothetical protein